MFYFCFYFSVCLEVKSKNCSIVLLMNAFNKKPGYCGLVKTWQRAFLIEEQIHQSSGIDSIENGQILEASDVYSFI